MASARTPAFFSCFDRRSAPWRVRLNTMAGHDRSTMEVATCTRSAWVTAQKRWVTSPLLLQRDGLVVGRVRLVVADEHVDVAVERGREEHRLALLVGEVEEAADLGQEPHVGHAVGLVDDDDADVVEAQRARSSRSWRRPGVATTTSTPRASAFIWRSMPAPPYTASTSVLVPQHRAWSWFCTWEASSRVGTRTRALGRRGAAFSTRASMGRPKAMVLPEPVGALPQTSRPARSVGDGGGLHGERLGDAKLVEAGAQAVGHAEIGEGGGHLGVFLHRGAGTRAHSIGWIGRLPISCRVQRSRPLLLGGSLKPQLDTARQRLLAHGHCTAPVSRTHHLVSAQWSR